MLQNHLSTLGIVFLACAMKALLCSNSMYLLRIWIEPSRSVEAKGMKGQYGVWWPMR